MSKFESLVGKSKTYQLGDIQIELKPCTLEDFDLLMDISDPTKQKSAMKELMLRALKSNGATEQEIKDFPVMKYFKQFSEALVDVNGLKNDTDTP